jgi:hypothetical protein
LATSFVGFGINQHLAAWGKLRRFERRLCEEVELLLVLFWARGPSLLLAGSAGSISLNTVPGARIKPWKTAQPWNLRAKCFSFAGALSSIIVFPATLAKMTALFAGSPLR